MSKFSTLKISENFRNLTFFKDFGLAERTSTKSIFQISGRESSTDRDYYQAITIFSQTVLVTDISEVNGNGPMENRFGNHPLSTGPRDNPVILGESSTAQSWKAVNGTTNTAKNITLSTANLKRMTCAKCPEIPAAHLKLLIPFTCCCLYDIKGVWLIMKYLLHRKLRASYFDRARIILRVQLSF